MMKGIARISFVGVAAAGLLAISYFTLPSVTSTTYESTDSTSARSTENGEQESVTLPPVDTRPTIAHVPLPEHVKAIYMTSCVAGTPSFRERLVTLIEETELNSVVIDIKDYSGTLSFSPDNVLLKGAWQNARCGARDMKEFVELLHQKGIYVIGRVTVFQDPYYANVRPELAIKRADGVTVWKDYKGLSFIDVAAKPYWDYTVVLAAESYNLGFDEINFDYVRYPSDGPMHDVMFPHTVASEYGSDLPANLEAFFVYLQKEMNDVKRYEGVNHINTGRATTTPYLSVDLFGMTTTNTDDLSIGQVQERAAPYFDFVAPMVYPSHYPDSFLGLGNPNNYPYKVVNYAMQSGVERMTASTTGVEGFLHERIGTSTPAVYTKPVYTADKFRAWIQDFDYGGDYDAADVRAEIQATYDAGVNSWMIWAPSNIYTKAALESE